jgi:hypothetical protein
MKIGQPKHSERESRGGLFVISENCEEESTPSDGDLTFGEEKCLPNESFAIVCFG